MSTVATQSPPTTPPDYLGQSVLNALEREYRGRFALSPLKSVILAVISLGLWPVFGLARRLSKFVLMERQQWMHVADWLILHGGGEPAMQLRERASRLWPRGGLGFITRGLALLGALMLVHRLRLARDLAATPLWIWLGPAACIAMAFLLQLVHILIQRRAYRGLLRAFNAVIERDGLEPVMWSRMRIPTAGGVLWILVGLVLAPLLIGIPFVAASAAQYGLAYGTAYGIRRQAAERLRKLMLIHPNASGDGGYRVHARRCERVGCGAALPPRASYCPRCGMATGAVA